MNQTFSPDNLQEIQSLYDSKSKGRIAVVNIMTQGLRSTEFDKFDKISELKPIRKGLQNVKESLMQK
jgi:hypothetical protein